jgi:hypothetical protein
MAGMETRIIEFAHGDRWHKVTSIDLSRPRPGVEVSFQLDDGEEYIVWPMSAKALPKMRGRVCTFRGISMRSSDPRAIVVFTDDGSRSVVDVGVLLPRDYCEKTHGEPAGGEATGVPGGSKSHGEP